MYRLTGAIDLPTLGATLKVTGLAGALKLSAANALMATASIWLAFIVALENQRA